MCPSVDVHAAHAADAFSAIVVENNWSLTLANKFLVQNIHHLQKRHIGVDVGDGVINKFPGSLGVLLSPDFEFEVHTLYVYRSLLI